MAHRKRKETKQQPGTAGPGNMLGCCLISFHFLWVIHPIRPVQGGWGGWPTGNRKKLSSCQAQLGQATCLAVA